MRRAKGWTDEAKRTYIESHYKLVDECWMFTGTTKGTGHRGYFPWEMSPARAVYEVYIGSIPADHDVAHLCQQRRCINPNHLKAMTRREHVEYDKRSTKFCENGHARTPDNIYMYKGRYKCRTCQYLANRRAYLKKRNG